MVTILVCISGSLIVIYRTRNFWRRTLSNPDDHKTTNYVWMGNLDSSKAATSYAKKNFRDLEWGARRH